MFVMVCLCYEFVENRLKRLKEFLEIIEINKVE